MEVRFRHRRLVVKADDYGRGPLVAEWRRFVDLCLDMRVVPSIGIVASDFSRNDTAKALARYFHDGLGVEFWNHSFYHRDMRRLSSEERIRDTKDAQKAIADALGVEPEVYGAPFNHLDEASVADIQAAGNFKGFYFRDDDGLTPGSIGKRFLMGPELGTQVFRPINYTYFRAVYDRRDYPDTVVLQVHPTYWSAECLVEFRRTLKTLLDDYYQPLTAADYLSSEPVSSPNRVETLDRGTVVAVTQEIYRVSLNDPKLDEAMHPGDRAYYFTRFQRGTSRLTNFLVEYGLLTQNGNDGSRAVLDIGAGVGNWAMAAAAASPRIKAVALDANPMLLEYVRAELGKLVEEPRCEFVSGRVEKLPFDPQTFDYVICNNALNYMPVEAALTEVSRVLKPSGLALFGIQNDLHPILDLLRHVELKDTAAALNRADRFFAVESRRNGGDAASSFVSYWTDDEFVTLAMFAGLQPQLRGTELPEDYGRIFGIPALWGYLFTYTDASRRRADAMLSGKGASTPDIEVLTNAGGTAFAWRLAQAAPEAAAKARNLGALLKQVARRESLDAAAVLKHFAEAGIAVPESVSEDLTVSLPLAIAKDWTELQCHYAEGSEKAAAARICAAWFAARESAKPMDRPADAGRFLDPVFDIGTGLMRGDGPLIRCGVELLFERARNQANCLRMLAAERGLPPELINAPGGPPDDIVVKDCAMWIGRIAKVQ